MQLTQDQVGQLYSDETGKYAIMALQGDVSVTVLGKDSVTIEAELSPLAEGEERKSIAPGTKLYFTDEGVVAKSVAPTYAPAKPSTSQGSCLPRRQG